MSHDRTKLLARIRALLAKTVEAGATEAEALAAAEKARALIEQYQINLGAEELEREGFDRKLLKFDGPRSYFGRLISAAITEFCEVRVWYVVVNTVQAQFKLMAGMPATEIQIFGLTSDVELAGYLMESLANFALAGANVYVATERKMAAALLHRLTAAQKTEIVRSYLFGCANRIGLRLQEMTQQRRTQSAKPGGYGALVKLDKPQIIAEELQRRGIRIHTDREARGAEYAEAFTAGVAHGGNASFGRPISGGIAGLIGREQK